MKNLKKQTNKLNLNKFQIAKISNTKVILGGLDNGNPTRVGGQQGGGN